MARATALSPCTSLPLRATKVLHPSLSQPSNLSFPNQPFCLHLSRTPQKCPTIIICHAKFDGSAGEENEEIGEVYFDDNDMIGEDSDGDDSESSIDLLIRFLQSMFKKFSKQAKKASRSILPSVISPQLSPTCTGKCRCLLQLTVLCFWQHFQSPKLFLRWFVALEALYLLQSCSCVPSGPPFPTSNQMETLLTQVEVHLGLHSQCHDIIVGQINAL